MEEKFRNELNANIKLGNLYKVPMCDSEIVSVNNALICFWRSTFFITSTIKNLTYDSRYHYPLLI